MILNGPVCRPRVSLSDLLRLRSPLPAPRARRCALAAERVRGLTLSCPEDILDIADTPEAEVALGLHRGVEDLQPRNLLMQPRRVAPAAAGRRGLPVRPARGRLRALPRTRHGVAKKAQRLARGTRFLRPCAHHFPSRLARNDNPRRRRRCAFPCSAYVS